MWRLPARSDPDRGSRRSQSLREGTPGWKRRGRYRLRFPSRASSRIVRVQLPEPTGTVDLLTMTASGAQVRRQRLDCALQLREIRRPVRARRSSDAEEDEVRIGQRLGGVIGEPQPAGRQRRLQHLRQSRLVERRLPIVELPGAHRVGVEAAHGVAEERQAGGRDRTDVTGADDRDLVARLLLIAADLDRCRERTAIRPQPDRGTRRWSPADRRARRPSVPIAVRVRASVMSGWRCDGSSWARSMNSTGESDPVSSRTRFASSKMVISCGLPMLTGPERSENSSRSAPSTRSSTWHTDRVWLPSP